MRLSTVVLMLAAVGILVSANSGAGQQEGAKSAGQQKKESAETSGQVTSESLGREMSEQDLRDLEAAIQLVREVREAQD